MAENNHKYCIACGSKLVGNAAFCGSCGAKQAAVCQPEPKVVVAPAPTPTAAPENSLAKPKTKLSMIGLIAAVLALVATGMSVVFGILELFDLLDYYGFAGLLREVVFTVDFGFAMFGSWLLPLFALIAVFAKKKGLAVAGLILTALMIVIQLSTNVIAFVHNAVFADVFYDLLRELRYDIWELEDVLNDLGLFRNKDLFTELQYMPNKLFGMVNGGYLLSNGWFYFEDIVIYGIGYSFGELLQLATNLFVAILHNVKNWLALVAFALVVFKKKAK